MKKCCSKCFRSSRKESQYSVKTMSNLENEAIETKPKQSQLMNIPLSTSSRSYLWNILESSCIFRGIPNEIYNDLIKEFKLLVIEKNKDIQKQDMLLGALYIINTGDASYVYNGKYVGPCSKSSFISELDFLFDCKRRLGVKTVTRCTIWTIDRSVCSNLFHSLKARTEEKLKSALAKSELFSGFSDLLKVELLKIAFPLFFKENDVILNQNEESSYVFLLASGRVKLDHGTTQEVLQVGQVFGNYSFFMQTSAYPRVQAMSPVEVFVMRLENMLEVLGSGFLDKFLKRLVFNTLASDEYTQEVPAHIVKRLVENFKFVSVGQGRCALNGSKVLSKKVVILLHGIISSEKNTFQGPQLFGFFNKNHLTVGTAKYLCQTDSLFAEVQTTELEKMVGANYETYVNDITIQVELSKIQFFSCFDKKYLGDLLKKATLQKFNKNESIFKKGQPANSLFCITQGSVGLYEDEDFLFRLDIGCVLGETCLKKSHRENSAIALTVVVCYEFSKNHALVTLNDRVWKYVDRCLNFYKPVHIDELLLQPPLVIARGREYCISKNIDGVHQYFSEVISKKKVQDNDSFYLIVDQKCALAQIVHPGIPRFIRTVSSPVQVIFLYEYLEFTILDWFKNHLNPMQVKFIIVSLAGILNYLHNKNILHRNICLENIAVDASGFVKLVGLKYCKQCKDRTYTILDTSPAYKAKETLQGSGYSKAAEAWALGVLLFELLTGKLPFQVEYGESLISMTEKVLNNSLQMPENLEDNDKNVIQKLLDENYKKRMSLHELVNSEWVKPFKIKDLALENSKSPLDNLKGIGKLFVQCENFAWRRLSRRDTTGITNTEVNEELEWDKYF